MILRICFVIDLIVLYCKINIYFFVINNAKFKINNYRLKLKQFTKFKDMADALSGIYIFNVFSK